MEHDECAQAGWEQRGPRVVAIGGGTGLSTMLRGLKNHTKNLTAIVTVADDGGVSGVDIERSANRIKVTIKTAKPGIVIGRGGAEVEVLRKELEKMTGKKININISEIKKPELDAQLVAEGIAAQLVKRIAFRRAMKQSVNRTMRLGAQGVKISCAGRLGGAEIARTEWYSEGKVPLHTLRADIDYGFAEANTTYGKIGVKVWIYKGEILPEAKARKEEAANVTA